MKEQLRNSVLCFQFDFKPKSVIICTLFYFLVPLVIIRTLFYFLINMVNVRGILIVCLIPIVYIVGALLLE